MRGTLQPYNGISKIMCGKTGRMRCAIDATINSLLTSQLIVIYSPCHHYNGQKCEGIVGRSEINLNESSKDMAEIGEGNEVFYDLTTPVTNNTVVYPGDPHFTKEDVCSLLSGAAFNLCQMHLGNHTGTHIDFPAHVIKNGKTSSDYPLKDLIGSGLIIEVPESEHSITRSFILSQPIRKNDFVFFKTANSRLSKQHEFTEKYVYIEPEAANELLLKGVKIVGVDYISVDKYDAEDLPVHHTLLSNNILIVEGLELNHVPLGRCKIFIIPNNIPEMDGLPVRAMARFYK